VSDLLDILIII